MTFPDCTLSAIQVQFPTSPHIGGYDIKRFGGLFKGVVSGFDCVVCKHVYYWTFWQSEWATDFISGSPARLSAVAYALLRHAFMTGTTERVLRYFNCPLDAEGLPRVHRQVVRPEAYGVRRQEDGQGPG